MRQEKERFFQIIFEENSHVLFRYICGQLNNDRETAKDVLNDVWEVLVVKFETVADLDEMAVLCGKKQDQESAQKTLLSE